MRKPDPEKLAGELRKRIETGRLTLEAVEAERIAAALETLRSRCGEAYQVVGSLASDAGLFGDPAVTRALDLLSRPFSKGGILPFHTAKDLKPAPAKPAKRSGK
jgi:hypothetical protein